MKAAYIYIFLAAMSASALVTPLVRWWALRIGAVSSPGGRNVNKHRVPRLGGVAIVVAFFAPLLALLATHRWVEFVLRSEWQHVLGVFAGGLAMAILGFIDDRRRIRALYKLYAQIAAALFAFGCGFRIDAVQLPFIGSLSMGVFALPVTVVWVVGIINAINLIDGLDGLAGGIVFFAGVTNFVVACVTGSTFVAIFMAAMLGAVLGFLFFNFNPARIFMGDSGSYFLGFILGTISLSGTSQKTSTAVSLLVPIVDMGVPIVDTLFTMVRRFLERRPLFSADRGHIHHRLLDLGLTHRRAVLLLYAVSVVFTAAAVGVSLGRSWQVGVAILAASVVAIGIARFVGLVEHLLLLSRQRARLRAPDTERLRFALGVALPDLSSSQSEEELWRALERLLAAAGLRTAELIDGKDAELLRWENPLALDASLLSVRFPVGRDDLSRVALRFRWASDANDVPAQNEILLQIVVDVVARRLQELGSVYAPCSEEPRREATTLPAIGQGIDVAL